MYEESRYLFLSKCPYGCRNSCRRPLDTLKNNKMSENLKEQNYNEYNIYSEEDYIRDIIREQIIIDMSQRELMYDNLRMRKVRQDFEKIEF